MYGRGYRRYRGARYFLSGRDTIGASEWFRVDTARPRSDTARPTKPLRQARAELFRRSGGVGNLGRVLVVGSGVRSGS